MLSVEIRIGLLVHFCMLIDSAESSGTCSSWVRMCSFRASFRGKECSRQVQTSFWLHARVTASAGFAALTPCALLCRAHSRLWHCSCPPEAPGSGSSLVRAAECKIVCCHLLIERQPVWAAQDSRALGSYLSSSGFRNGSQGLCQTGEEGPMIIFEGYGYLQRPSLSAMCSPDPLPPFSALATLFVSPDMLTFQKAFFVCLTFLTLLGPPIMGL